MPSRVTRPPGPLGAVASLGLQGAGQADQARGVGRGGIDPDGVVAVPPVEGRECPGQKARHEAGRWDSRGAGPGSRHRSPKQPQAADAASSGWSPRIASRRAIAAASSASVLLISAGRSGINVEIEPAQTEDVGIAGRVPCPGQAVVRPGQQIESHGVNGDVARHTAQPVGFFEQSLVVVEPAGKRAAPEAAAGVVTATNPALAIKRRPQHPQLDAALPAV